MIQWKPGSDTVGWAYGGASMPLTTSEVELPTTLSQDDARIALAAKLFEMGRVTMGEGAAIAGVSKPTFMEMLARYGVAVFNYSAEDLRTEVEG
jgi:predicted HTH domain antitoxin